MKIKRGDTNGVGEYKVRKLHPGEAQTKTEHGMMVLRHGGALFMCDAIRTAKVTYVVTHAPCKQ